MYSEKTKITKKILRNWIKYYWFKLLKNLRISVLSKDVIPKNTPYCYKGDKVCPYYLKLDGEYNACLYEGKKTYDFIFADQCKMCGISEFPIRENDSDI